jgi:hypothetical protein
MILLRLIMTTNQHSPMTTYPALLIEESNNSYHILAFEDTAARAAHMGPAFSDIIKYMLIMTVLQPWKVPV